MPRISWAYRLTPPGVCQSSFGSDFGKTESWYIIGLREDQEEKPYVLLGFKEGITRKYLRSCTRNRISEPWKNVVIDTRIGRICIW